MAWIPYVMVRITIFFVAGVLAGIHFPSLFPLTEATVFLTIFSTVYFALRFWLMRTQMLRLASGGIGLMVIFLAGFLCVLLRDGSQRTDSLLQQKGTVQAYQMKLVSGPERREKSWRAFGRIQSICTDAEWTLCDSQLMVHWPLTARADTLNSGDILVVKGSPRLIDGPFNPNEFDYRRFLALRNIFHQHFIQEGHWVKQRTVGERGPTYYAAKARHWTTDVIQSYVTGDRERAIVGAFVIGVTEGIDDDLKQAYAAGGAMHALAVSGMHVSILYGVLLFLLRPLEKRRHGSWIIAVVSILALWMYAFVTGLSPSVLRAVTMFSFVALAKPMGRTTSIINTLAASAFFLLLYDPYLLLSAGFQLSYLAVLGIVLLYRPIYNLWEHRWAWSDWVWQITCVSIAAQIATLPVTLYYFHQFPVYFLLANLFVIPASAIILLGGILLLVVSPIAILATWIGKGLALLVYVLNAGLFWVEQLPSSLITSIPLTLLQAFCIAGFVMVIYRLIQSREFYWSIVLLVLTLVFSLDSWLGNRDESAQFVVYRISRHSSMDWIQNRWAVSFMDSALLRDPGAIQYHMQPNRLASRVDRVEMISPNPANGLGAYEFREKRFLWISNRALSLPAGLQIDYLVIGNNGVHSLESLTRNVKFDSLILDSSNSWRYCERLRAEAARLRIPCFSVLTDGAFTLTL